MSKGVPSELPYKMGEIASNSPILPPCPWTAAHLPNTPLKKVSSERNFSPSFFGYILKTLFHFIKKRPVNNRSLHFSLTLYVFYTAATLQKAAHLLPRHLDTTLGNALFSSHQKLKFFCHVRFSFLNRIILANSCLFFFLNLSLLSSVFRHIYFRS